MNCFGPAHSTVEHYKRYGRTFLTSLFSCWTQLLWSSELSLPVEMTSLKINKSRNFSKRRNFTRFQHKRTFSRLLLINSQRIILRFNQTTWKLQDFTYIWEQKGIVSLILIINWIKRWRPCACTISHADFSAYSHISKKGTRLSFI